MKLTQRRSWTTWTMSPERSASPAAQCRTVPPAKWPPRRRSVRPSPSSRVSPFQELDPLVRAHHPLAVGRVQVDGRVEGARPLDHRRVVVRMRDRDRADPAELLDPRAELVVEERDAVPEDVAAPARSPDEERALADRE